MKKTALILGGSKGLGWASVKKMASQGWNLIIIHRDPRNHLDAFYAEIEDLKNQNKIEIKSFNKDATRLESIQKLISQLKKDNPELKIDLLLHSIAKGSLKMLHGEEKLSELDFSITIQAMGHSLYQWVNSLHESNLLNNPAKILAFTSEGNQKAWPGYAAVSSAKGVLEAISRSIAVEYAKFGITSNCIQAGLTITEAFKQIPNSQKLAKAREKQNPMGRLTTPEDVANVVYLMSKPEANWINGSIIKVDGGESIT